MPPEMCFVTENGVPISAWVMRETEANRARYNAIFDSLTPPTTRAEALERAGATFSPSCRLHVVKASSLTLLFLQKANTLI